MRPHEATELEWLLHLLRSNPFAWSAHVKHRAKELAREPEFADLPRQVAAELERLRNRAMRTTTKAAE